MNKANREKERKRARTIEFTLNRSTPYIKEKYIRVDAETRMANAQKELEPGFFDISETINAPTNAQGAIPKRTEGVGKAVQNFVARSLSEMKCSVDSSVRGLQENMNQDLAAIRDDISNLANAVRAMTLSLPGNARLHTDRNSDTSPPPAYRSTEQRMPNQYNVPPPPIPVPAQQTRPIPETGFIHESERIRIDKFGLKFDGNPKNLSVEDFIFRLEHLQVVYRVPWSEVIRDFRLLLSGNAEQWYWLYLTTNQLPDWPSVRFALLNQYKMPLSNFDIMHDLVERRQRPGESIDSYFHHLNLLRSRLGQPVSEFDMIKIAKRNLGENIGRIVYPMSVSSVEELRIACNEAERNFPRKDTRAMPTSRPLRQVNEVNLDLECSETPADEEISVSAIEDLVCWNCQDKGHGFRDCPSVERNIFCYRCGRPNTITPKCPKCRQGNSKRSVSHPGDSRAPEMMPK